MARQRKQIPALDGTAALTPALPRTTPARPAAGSAKLPLTTVPILDRVRQPALCPAGVLILRRLQAVGLTRQQFSAAIGFASPMEATRLLDGRKRITSGIAVRLERFFDIPTRRWLDLQLRHDLATLNPAHVREVRRKIPTLDATLHALGKLPIR